jgi:hypothetical protein
LQPGRRILAATRKNPSLISGTSTRTRASSWCFAAVRTSTTAPRRGAECTSSARGTRISRPQGRAADHRSRQRGRLLRRARGCRRGVEAAPASTARLRRSLDRGSAGRGNSPRPVWKPHTRRLSARRRRCRHATSAARTC